ncbi:MAG: hypothetical protein K940chlam7_01107 [Chlamydiae bacterium]|nr:hypothetical protein [Chlamydiota bacterium]
MLGIFLDIETTGLDPLLHRPIDIALKVIDLATGEIKGEYQSLIKQSSEVWEQSDPVSIEVNGYTLEQVQQGKDLEVVRKEVVDLFTRLGIARGKAFFICQNPAFDRGFFTQIVGVYTQEKLNWPYHWLDLASMYWATFVHGLNESKGSIPGSINLSKNAIAGKYHIPPEVQPHHAMNGVDHLIQCYQAVIGMQWEYSSEPARD